MMATATQRRFQSQEYEDYSTTSQNYDKTRQPLLPSLHLGHFMTSSTTQLPNQTILDAGCGTGNYINAVRAHVGKVIGVEFNSGMLSQARSKFSSDHNVTLMQGSVLDLPLPAACVDGVMINQVVHHLETPETRVKFSNLGQAFRECFRVIKPGGCFGLNHCTPEQVMDGMWWTDLVARAIREEYVPRSAPQDVVIAHLKEAGFEDVECVVPVTGVLMGAEYFRLDGPTDETWRQGDSGWSLPTQEEIDAAVKRVQDMKDNGTLQEYFNKREALRAKVGQTTFFFARKPATA